MRSIKTVVSVLLCLLLLVGCSTGKNLSAEEIASQLKDLAGETIDWVELDRSKLSSYFELEEDTVSAFKAYINRNEERFDMIAVFAFKDDKAKKAIISEIGVMSELMTANYLLANEDEAHKISKKIVAQTEDCIILCILDQNKDIKKFITDELCAEIV